MKYWLKYLRIKFHSLWVVVIAFCPAELSFASGTDSVSVDQLCQNASTQVDSNSQANSQCEALKQAKKQMKSLRSLAVIDALASVTCAADSLQLDHLIKARDAATTNRAAVDLKLQTYRQRALCGAAALGAGGFELASVLSSLSSGSGLGGMMAQGMAAIPAVMTGLKVAKTYYGDCSQGPDNRPDLKSEGQGGESSGEIGGKSSGGSRGSAENSVETEAGGGTQSGTQSDAQGSATTNRTDLKSSGSSVSSSSTGSSNSIGSGSTSGTGSDSTSSAANSASNSSSQATDNSASGAGNRSSDSSTSNLNSTQNADAAKSIDGRKSILDAKPDSKVAAERNKVAEQQAIQMNKPKKNPEPIYVEIPEGEEGGVTKKVPWEINKEKIFGCTYSPGFVPSDSNKTEACIQYSDDCYKDAASFQKCDGGDSPAPAATKPAIGPSSWNYFLNSIFPEAHAANRTLCNDARAQADAARAAALTFGTLAFARFQSLQSASATVKTAEHELKALAGDQTGLAEAGTKNQRGGGGGGGSGSNSASGDSNSGGISSSYLGSQRTFNSQGSGNSFFGSPGDNAVGLSALAGGTLESRLLAGPLGHVALNRAAKLGITEQKFDSFNGAESLFNTVAASFGLRGRLSLVTSFSQRSSQSILSHTPSAGVTKDFSLSAGIMIAQPRVLKSRGLAETQQANDSHDVFHTGTTMNIFEIVSRRIGANYGRVGVGN